MSVRTSLLLLAVAACLEAGGDALVRCALRAPAGLAGRVALLAVGGLVLLGYAVLVNTPNWSFGRLLGVYVVFFFLVAQGIDATVFGVAPRLPVVIGGALVAVGGLVLTIWR